jgi:hypothetical protein
MDRFTDLDQGGHGYQRVRTWKGPSLGWQDTIVKPVFLVQQPAWLIQPGDSIIMVDTTIGYSTSIYLPDAVSWVQQPGYHPATGFEGSIWIKDIGGQASFMPIFVYPFSGQKIDNLAGPFQIVQNRQLLRLYPIVEWRYPPGEFIGWFTG